MYIFFVHKAEGKKVFLLLCTFLYIKGSLECGLNMKCTTRVFFAEICLNIEFSVYLNVARFGP